MVLIYILWFLGVVFGILTIAELAIIIYRIAKNISNVKNNIICAVIFVIISIGCTSSAILVVFEKISDSNISLSKKSADITANVYKGFKENWHESLYDEFKSQ